MFLCALCSIILMEREKNMELKTMIERIGYIRVRANLSARKLSLLIGKNPGYIHMLEQNKNFAPTFETLSAILEVCNTTSEEFFYYDLFEYKTDAQALNFFKTLSQKQKNAIMNLYK